MENEISQLFHNFGKTPIEYDDLLKEIKDFSHLKKIVPSSFLNSIYAENDSLYDLLQYSEDDLYRKFRGFGVGKVNQYFHFKKKLFELESKIEVTNFYMNEIAEISIPLNYSPQNSISTDIEQLIKDVVFLYESRGKKKLVEVLKLYYGLEGNRIHETEEIAELFGMTKERIRQYIRTPQGSVLSILFSNPYASHDRIKVQAELFNRVTELKSCFLYTQNIFEFISNGEPIDNLQHLERLIEFFDLKISKYGNSIFLTDSEVPITVFEEHFRAAEQVLKSEDNWIDWEQLTNKIKKEINKKFEFNEELTRKILELNPNYFSVKTENMTSYFQVEWPNLSNQSLQVRRILLEKKSVLKKDEILSLYNQKCREYGLPQILENELYLSGKEKIISFGNNTWGYGDSDENRLTGQQFIEQYLQNNNGFTHFDTIKNVLIENHYNYPDNSIRAYLSQSCRISLDDNQIFIHEDFIAQYPTIKLRNKMNKELGDWVLEKIFECFSNRVIVKKQELIKSINSWGKQENIKGKIRASIEYNLNKLIQIGAIKIEANNDLLLDNELLESIGKISSRPEPGYRKVIRSLAIDYLKGTKNAAVPLKKLVELFQEHIPSDIKIQNLYKIFGEDLFLKTIINGKPHIQLKIENLPEAKTREEETIDTTIPFEELESDVIETIIPVPDSRPTPEIFKYVNEREAFEFSKFDKQIRKELIQIGLNNEWISDGLATFYNALKINGDYSRWGSSLLQSIFDLWFSRTDFYDREACIIKLTHGFETYLKKLDSDLLNLDGLGTCIHSNYQLESLYTYNFEAKSIPSSLINHEKRKFSKTIRSLVFYRNLFTHDNNSEHLEMGLHNQIKFASDFIALYVYVGYLLKD
ncbi:hypothetical protein [Daejeonella sp.]|jgi:hypothetical protein|uniref:hypothetical protein n=1 Tax=Daejeonella sp. TaxID=2805397 RepID=UPI0037C18101